jgi:hypothetical protein
MPGLLRGVLQQFYNSSQSVLDTAAKKYYQIIYLEDSQYKVGLRQNNFAAGQLYIGLRRVKGAIHL